MATGELPRELERYMLQFYGVFRRRETWERACQYLVGLLSDLPRKNGETLAASITDVPNVQSIHQFLAVSPWSARELDRRRVQHALEVACSGRECTVVLDEVSILKQGRHSVGVKRQYLGCVGKTANGQVAVTLHYCDDRYDWPITGQLYLPREWAEDRVRRQRARVPEDVPFATKAQIAMTWLTLQRQPLATPADPPSSTSGTEPRPELPPQTSIPVDGEHLTFRVAPIHPRGAPIPRPLWESVQAVRRRWLQWCAITVPRFLARCEQPVTPPAFARLC